MGAPLIVFGSSFNYLIPKSGKWMLEIKNLLAFALLGTAVWFGKDFRKFYNIYDLDSLYIKHIYFFSLFVL